MMHYLMIIALALACGQVADAQGRQGSQGRPAPPSDALGGSYACKGTHPGGSYGIQLVVWLSEGDQSTYSLRWLGDGDAVAAVGAARLDAGRLVAGFAQQTDVGLAIYRIDGARLVGTWVCFHGTSGTETCTRAGTRPAE